MRPSLGLPRVARRSAESLGGASRELADVTRFRPLDFFDTLCIIINGSDLSANDTSGAFMITRHFGIPALICCAAILPACGSSKYEWSQATTLNTIAASRTLLSKSPNDAHAADARSRVAQLQEEQAWAAAQLASTAD